MVDGVVTGRAPAAAAAAGLHVHQQRRPVRDRAAARADRAGPAGVAGRRGRGGQRVLPRLRARAAGVGHRVRPGRAGARDADRAVRRGGGGRVLGGRAEPAGARHHPGRHRGVLRGRHPDRARLRRRRVARRHPPAPGLGGAHGLGHRHRASRRSARAWWPTSSAGGRCRACPPPPRPGSPSRCAGCPSRNARTGGQPAALGARRVRLGLGQARAGGRAGRGRCRARRAHLHRACGAGARAGPRPSPGSSRRRSGWARWPARGWCGRWSSG